MARKLKAKAKRKSVPKAKQYRHPRDELGGKPIMDATQPLELSIVHADVKGAKEMDPTNCGAARAIIRQEHVKAARVYRSVIFVEFKDRVERYQTPARLRQETISFDRGAGGQFLEGDYKLLPPCDSHRLGARSQRNRTKSSGGADKSKREWHPAEGTRNRAPVYYRPK